MPQVMLVSVGHDDGAKAIVQFNLQEFLKPGEVQDLVLDEIRSAIENGWAITIHRAGVK